jgi:hypothetical protein
MSVIMLCRVRVVIDQDQHDCSVYGSMLASIDDPWGDMRVPVTIRWLGIVAALLMLAGCQTSGGFRVSGLENPNLCRGAIESLVPKWDREYTSLIIV